MTKQQLKKYIIQIINNYISINHLKIGYNSDTIASEFLDAIKPKNYLNNFGYKQSELNKRIETFIDNYNRNDGEIVKIVKDRYHKKIDDIDRFIDKISIKKIRTCYDKLLDTIVDNFIEYDGIILFLENTNPDPQLLNDYQNLIEPIYEKITRIMKRNYNKELIDNLSGEEFVSMAILKLIETASDPTKGYTYEGDLKGFIYVTAINLIKDKLHYMNIGYKKIQIIKTQIQNNSVPLNLTRPLFDFIQSMQERYLLIESFFKKDDQLKVKELWSFMLPIDPPLGNPTINDIVNWINATLSLSGNKRVNISWVDRTKRKIRQLLLVLELEDKFNNDYGDHRLIQYMQQNRLGGNLSAVREVAAWAKAAPHNLIWVLICRHFKIFNTNAYPNLNDSYDASADILQDRGLFNNKNKQNLIQLKDWIDYNSNIIPLFKQITHFKGPCCFLMLMMSLDENTIIEKLCPDSGNEKDKLKNELSALSKIIP